MQTIIPDSHPLADKTLGDMAELNARRTAAAAVLGDYKAALASAPLTSPPGREWTLRLASVLGGLLDALGPDGGEDQGERDGEDLEPYCYTCGASIGIFQGRGPAWRHYRGAGTPQNPAEVYDAAHTPVVAWAPAGAP
jgi:hypothetical protein